MVEPLKLVPPRQKAREVNKARILKQLEFYRKEVEAGDIDQIAICATYKQGGCTTSSVELDGKRVALIGAMHTWLHRITWHYVEDLERE